MGEDFVTDDPVSWNMIQYPGLSKTSAICEIKKLKAFSLSSFLCDDFCAVSTLPHGLQNSFFMHLKIRNVYDLIRCNTTYNIPIACLLNRSPVPAVDLKSNRSGL